MGLGIFLCVVFPITLTVFVIIGFVFVISSVAKGKVEIPPTPSDPNKVK